MNKLSDDQFIQSRICAEASQILLIAEQNLRFCSHPQRNALRNGGKMYEQEEKRTTHLTILICNSIFIIALFVESIVLKWEAGAVVLLLIGFAASWALHITERIPAHARLMMYVVLTMLALFFYGIHATSIDGLAPAAVVVILLYTATEECIPVRICAITYFLTMFYDFVFVIDSPFTLPTHTIARILIHFVLVFMAERLAETIIRRRMEEKKKTGEKIFQLEETNRSVEDFLTNVSHELRTPINAVTGITSLMLKNEKETEKRKDMISIQMAGNRLFKQVENILDYTEIDTGRIVVNEENYMISSVLNDIISENQMMNSDSESELIFDMDAGIPMVLFGDGKKVKKIISHLIDNAVKFTKEGGIYVRVYALQKPYGINLCIKVSDTGIGITEEDLEKITERFFQSNAGRNRRAGGLGLGLSIVYGMVTSMGGFMRLESASGSGTTVFVSIPQKIADATPSMALLKPEDLCIGLYLRPEKYAVPEIRDYYNGAISHMIQDLGFVIHRVFALEELKKLTGMYHLTHLIIGKEEYEEEAAYFEALDQGTKVIVVADDSFRPMNNSRITFVRKPYYSLSIVNVLNSQPSLEPYVSEQDHMTCPGVRVLVVDDEPMNLMVAEGIFNAYEMDVKTAGSGMEAIELCKNEEFDLIFLDHMMPEMDGVETLRILRGNEKDQGMVHTVIAFTANAVSGAREMFRQEGFDEFLPKPIEDQELRRLLKKMLPKDSIVYGKAGDKKRIPVNGEKSDAEQSTAVQDKGSATDKLASLEGKGFQTKAGLQYSHNDSAFYEQILQAFTKSAEGRMKDIETAFQGEDIANYQIYVHALKSSSKMLGADTLSEMAKEAEEAAKNRDVTYIRDNHERLMEKYKATVQDILDVLCIEDTVSPEEIKAAGIDVSKEEICKRLSELKESLDTFEMNAAETLLKEMSELVYRGTPVSELLKDARQDVDDFEMGKAAEKVEALISRMEGGEL